MCIRDRNIGLVGVTGVYSRWVCVAGVPLGTPGATNMMRVAFVGG